jgi:hypothetical protein
MMTTMQTMVPKALIAVLAASARLFGLVSAALSGPDGNVAQGLTLAVTGLALRGYEPVASCTEGRPVMGQATYAAVHSGATSRCATQAPLQACKANPETYVPHYDGFCAYGVAVGAQCDGDPMLWKIGDGKLSRTLSPDMQTKWDRDIRGHRTKADTNGSVIQEKAPAALGEALGSA